MSFTEEITLSGHIIDSLILPRVFDTVMDLGGNFDVLKIEVGKHKNDPSWAHMRIIADSEELLNRILMQLTDFGAEMVAAGDVQTRPAPRDGALPPDFYSTTNFKTEVRLYGEWVPVSGTEMDVAVVVNREARTAHTAPMLFVKEGDPIAVGHEGIRVHPVERSRGADLTFSFMNSDVSSEKPKRLAIHEIAGLEPLHI